MTPTKPRHAFDYLIDVERVLNDVRFHIQDTLEERRAHMLNIESEIRRYHRLVGEVVKEENYTHYLIKEYKNRIVNPHTTERDRIVMHDSLLPMAEWKIKHLQQALLSHKHLLEYNDREYSIIKDNVEYLRQELVRVDSIIQHNKDIRLEAETQKN